MKGKSIMFAAACALLAILPTIFMGTIYRRDAEFEMFTNDLTVLVDAMVDELSDDPTPAKLATAQKILDAKKDGLRRKLDELKMLSESRISGKAQLRFQASLSDNGKRIRWLLGNPKLIQAARRDPALREQVKKLYDDYLSMLHGERAGP